MSHVVIAAYSRRTTAIIHLQQRRIYRLTNENLEGQMGRNQYPIAKPVIEDGSEYRIPCTRLVLGLKYYDDARGTINRHIWNEMQVSIPLLNNYEHRHSRAHVFFHLKSTARAVISSARLLNTLNDKLNYKKLSTDRKNALRGQVIIVCLYINNIIRYSMFILPLR